MAFKFFTAKRILSYTVREQPRLVMIYRLVMI